MLNKDALEIDSRIQIAEDNIKKDFVVKDTEIIKGLEIVRSINEEINPIDINEETYSKYNESVNSYFNKKEENFSFVSSALRKGTIQGLAIVSSVSLLNKNKKVKIKGNN